ncbi:MAG: hypothetical protein CMQ88_00140 [Gammaproteobacteria bacterium]|nr:hypothetical protein [Gammaproteobacteria bacterium]|tara:strand:- start:1431 stop:1619 length:189 start_codon:yes stop_codon:yes gene_type:complete
MLAVRREKVAIIREFQGTAIKVFNLGVFLLINRLIETVIGRVMGSIFWRRFLQFAVRVGFNG